MSGLRRAGVLGSVVILGMAVIAVLLAFLQGPDQIGPGFAAFFKGVAGNETSLASTTRYLTPILLIAVSASVSTRAGLFDVGQIGQYVIGGLVAAAVGAVVPGPGLVIASIALTCGAVAGGCWAWLVGRLSYATQVQLVVLSLIANSFADGLARYITRTFLQDPGKFSVVATRELPHEAWLPILVPRTSLHLGFLIAIFIAIAVWVVIRYTTIGHRLTMFGRNPRFAAVAGVDSSRFPLRVLLCSGSIAGLAGAIEVFGVYHRYQDGTLGGSNSIAWTGLTAAILIPAGVLVMIPVSMFLAALTTGLVGVQREIGITSGLGTLVQGLLIVIAAVALTKRVDGPHPRKTPHSAPAALEDQRSGN
ncbi:ABC transporter permease [Rhodococcus globerulus]|uniref:ABC transporter permease n=1 Tax=Rhodococcus globerulus TaxID=33008 RepID=A0ABU4C2U4_RHOGO|nr:hypothetical protein [Rhodococcus globerulus]MDV6270812.1 hypothetical protein [Rhodococcus globerulus]